MKKVLIVVVAAFFLAMVAQSCKPTQKCAAYGEHYKYQKDTRR
jgi:hypothetical protein